MNTQNMIVMLTSPCILLLPIVQLNDSFGIFSNTAPATSATYVLYFTVYSLPMAPMFCRISNNYKYDDLVRETLSANQRTSVADSFTT